MSPISESAKHRGIWRKAFREHSEVSSAGGLRLAQPRRVEWSQRETGKGA